MPGILEYDNNNSGGIWWLSETDYDNLEKAGWTVHWARKDSNAFLEVATRVYDDNPKSLLGYYEKTEVTYMGTKAVSAAKRFDSKEEGIDEWEKLTNQDAGAEGCNCCGPPHNFVWHDDDGTKIHSDLEITSKLSW